MNMIKKTALASALAVTTVAAASPAMARDHRRGDDTAAIAIGAGIIGLAIVASIDDDDRHDRYYDHRYRQNGWHYRDGYYWDRDGRRYDRNGRRHYDNRYYARRGYNSDYYGRYGYRGY